MNLKNELLISVDGCNNLEGLVDAFENFCQAHTTDNNEDIMLLFETGTFGCIGEKMFQFSLVRQCPNEDEEYCQLHLNILYQPNDKNATFSNSVWDEDIETNFFTYIRQSEAYLALIHDEITKVDIYQDET